MLNFLLLPHAFADGTSGCLAFYFLLELEMTSLLVNRSTSLEDQAILHSDIPVNTEILNDELGTRGRTLNWKTHFSLVSSGKTFTIMYSFRRAVYTSTRRLI